MKSKFKKWTPKEVEILNEAIVKTKNKGRIAAKEAVKSLKGRTELGVQQKIRIITNKKSNKKIAKKSKMTTSVKNIAVVGGLNEDQRYVRNKVIRHIITSLSPNDKVTLVALAMGIKPSK